MTDKPDMAALQKDLDAAIDRKREADKDESAARNRASTAGNALNAAQRAFDAGVTAIRVEASKVGGDWRETHGGV